MAFSLRRILGLGFLVVWFVILFKQGTGWMMTMIPFPEINTWTKIFNIGLFCLIGLVYVDWISTKKNDDEDDD